MEIVGPEEFIVNEEVDELRWCTLGEAHALLTYEHDRKLLSSVGSMPRELTNQKKSP
jgi:8-oxo-dGTP diphosphatase